MPSLALHPKLPQELRDKIFAYVLRNEFIGLEVVNYGNAITGINYWYHSSFLKKLMHDEDVRDQIQHLVYEHAILEVERSVVWKIGRDEGVGGQSIPKMKLRHFRLVNVLLHLPQKYVGELLDSINYLSLVSAPTKSVVGEGHYVVLVARVAKMHFRLAPQAVVEVAMEPYWEPGDWNPIQTFRVLPNVARDEDARKWYAQELKGAMTSLAG